MFAPFFVELQSQHESLDSFVPRTEDILIGRSSRRGRADLNIQDPYLSTEHARVHFLLPAEPLRVESGILATLTDTSTNGTFVNSTKLSRGSTAQLRDGDVITLSKAKPNPATVPPAIGRIAFVVRAKHEQPGAPVASSVSLNPFSSRPITDTMPDAYDAPAGTLWGTSGAAAAGLSQCVSQAPLDVPAGAPSLRSLTSGFNGLRQSVISFSYTRETYRRTGDLWSDYGRLGHLGDGAYSKVWLVYSRVTGERFAAKEVLKTGTSGPVGPGTARKAAGEPVDILEDEIAALSACKHPNIVRFVDRYTAADGHTWLILELANGGEVFSKVIAKKRFQEESARKLFSQILRGVAHMHARGVVHRDIKPENVFLHQYMYTPTPEDASSMPAGHPLSRPHARYIPKLGDFGMARIVTTGSSVRMFPDLSGGEGEGAGAGAGVDGGVRSQAPLQLGSHHAAAKDVAGGTHGRARAAGRGAGLSRFASIVGTAQYLCPEGYLLWKQPTELSAHFIKRRNYWRILPPRRTLGDERGAARDYPPLMGALWVAGVGPVWEASWFPQALTAAGKRPREEEACDAGGEVDEYCHDEFDMRGAAVRDTRRDVGPVWPADLWTPPWSGANGVNPVPAPPPRDKGTAGGTLPRVFVTAAVAVWDELPVRMRRAVRKVAAAREAALARALASAPAEELRSSVVFRPGVGFVIAEVLLTKYDAHQRIQEAQALEAPAFARPDVSLGAHTLLRSTRTLAVLDDMQVRGYDGFAFDAYSLGAMLYVLLSGRHLRIDSLQQEGGDESLLSGLEQAVLGSTFLEHDPWACVSAEARDLVFSLVNPDPELRLTTTQALSHPWVLGKLMWEVPPPESTPRFAVAPPTASSGGGAASAGPMAAIDLPEAVGAPTAAGAASDATPRATARDDLADTQAVGVKVRFPFKPVEAAPAPARNSRGGARGSAGTRGGHSTGHRTVIFSPRGMEVPCSDDVEAEAAADSLLEFPFLPSEAT